MIKAFRKHLQCSLQEISNVRAETVNRKHTNREPGHQHVCSAVDMGLQVHEQRPETLGISMCALRWAWGCKHPNRDPRS